MWEDMNEDDRAICLELAKAIWHTDNPRSDAEDQDARGEIWRETKKEEMQRAIKVMKRLKAAGVSLAAPAA